VVANWVTGNEINVPTVDDLFPLDDIEDDELIYFREITVAENLSDLEADQGGRCSQSEGTLSPHSHIVGDDDEGAVRMGRSCVEGSDS
jgi:hypothetical protein